MDVPIEFCEPTITVRVNGVAFVVLPTVTRRPLGTEVKVRSTVSGSIRRVTTVDAPSLSVAVSRTSR